MFLLTGQVRAVVYSKPMAIAGIGMIPGIMGRTPAVVGGLHGIHLGGTHLGLWTGHFPGTCTVYSAGWGSSQEVDGSVDLVPANVEEAHDPKAAIYFCLSVLSIVVV